MDADWPTSLSNINATKWAPAECPANWTDLNGKNQINTQSRSLCTNGTRFQLWNQTKYSKLYNEPYFEPIDNP